MSHVLQNNNEKIQHERWLITGQGPDTAWETSGGQFDGSIVQRSFAVAQTRTMTTRQAQKGEE